MIDETATHSPETVMSTRLALEPDPSVAGLEAARDLLRRGGVLAMPTESYYALGACVFSPFVVDDGAIRNRQGKDGGGKSD